MLNADIVEILAIMLDGVKCRYSLEDIHKDIIKKKKVDVNLLNTAYVFLLDNILVDKKIKKVSKTAKNKSFRILNDDELDVLGVENYDYILYLKNVGLITDSQVNTLIDEITAIPIETVSKDELNWMVLMMLFNAADTFLPPGNRLLIRPSDSIN